MGDWRFFFFLMSIQMVFQNNLSGLNLKKVINATKIYNLQSIQMGNHIKTRVHTFRKLVNGVFIEVILAA